ncbi:MAG: PA2778 family cysteine peptidase [Gammaproteobacteria bacterium]|nr:PA2778 family cysteine peptidase [Gammaproteobacteria bacterium]
MTRVYGGRLNKGRIAAAAAGAVMVLLNGCAMRPLDSTEPSGIAGGERELREVAFFRQTAYHCGPAALATVLQYSGVVTSAYKLAEKIYIPGRKGSLQAEMAAAARRENRIAYRIKGELEHLLREVAAGRPVLVLQNLSPTRRPMWHYAVVIGFNQAKQTIVLRSGTTRRLETSMREFNHSWRRAGAWALIVLRPGELPAQIDEQAYGQAVAPLERLNQWAAAQAAWKAVLELWPRSLVFLVGLANARYGQGDISGAASILQQAVRHHPSAGIAHNNLAHTLGELGDIAQALSHAHRAVELGGPRINLFRQTLSELRAKRQRLPTPGIF